MTRWQKVLGIFTLGAALHLGLTLIFLTGGCEPAAAAADAPTPYSPAGGSTVPVGDLSWPAALLAVGYLLRGWSPSVTVRVARVKDDAR